MLSFRKIGGFACGGNGLGEIANSSIGGGERVQRFGYTATGLFTKSPRQMQRRVGSTQAHVGARRQQPRQFIREVEMRWKRITSVTQHLESFSMTRAARQ